MSFNLFLIEKLNTDFPPLYHGTASDQLIKTKTFKDDDVYLTDDIDEAESYAYGKHLGGSSGDKKYILTIMAKKAKVFNGQDDVDKIIVDEHDEFDDLDELMNWARHQKYHYVTFKHPNTKNDEYHNVVVSLYPNKNLEIIDIDQV